MFHLVQFLFQTVLQPLWDSTWRLYERFIAFFNGVVVPMKLAHVCDHVMKFFQKVFLCEVIGGTSNCIYSRIFLFRLLWRAIRCSIKPRFSQACSPKMGGAIVIAT